MKKLTWVLSLMLSLVSTGMAAANEVFCTNAGPLGISVSASFPGLRLVYGRPGVYCWYHGRYYSRAAWEHFRRFDRDRYAYYRSHRDDDRNFGRPDLRNDRRDDNRGFDRDGHQDRDRF